MPASYPDKALEALRTLVDVINSELTTVKTSPELEKAWNELIAILALGPSPELRTCPSCNEVGMRAASRCSRCWATLPVLPSAS
jgi:hypothetical protein